MAFERILIEDFKHVKKIIQNCTESYSEYDKVIF